MPVRAVPEAPHQESIGAGVAENHRQEIAQVAGGHLFARVGADVVFGDFGAQAERLVKIFQDVINLINRGWKSADMPLKPDAIYVAAIGNDLRSEAFVAVVHLAAAVVLADGDVVVQPGSNFPDQFL